MVQWCKDPALLLQQLRSLQSLGFDPQPRDFHSLQMGPRKKKQAFSGLSYVPPNDMFKSQPFLLCLKIGCLQIQSNQDEVVAS